jgi:hypothetical protein
MRNRLSFLALVVHGILQPKGRGFTLDKQTTPSPFVLPDRDYHAVRARNIGGVLASY